MKQYKLNMTRPEFLMKFISSDGKTIIDLDELQKILPVSYPLIYTAYSVIINSNLESNEIPYVNNDGETVVLKFISKKIPKDIKSNFHKECIRFGTDEYKILIKNKDNYMFVSLEKIEKEKPIENDD